MAHPTYSSQQLLNRGMIKVKKVASDLGVLPTGDKRLIQNWIDAIIEHQSAQVQKIEVVEATIDFESEQLMFCLKRYYGTTEDGREFSIVVRNDESSVWVEDVEYDDDFTEEELEEIKAKFYEGV